MIHWISGHKRAFMLAAAVLLVAACGSIPMKSVRVVTSATADTVLVSFVRPSNVVGDGIAFDVWDGTHYVGALGAAKLLQYQTTPGEHVFLGDSGVWSYAAGNLLAGKQYFLKINMVPAAGRVVWGVADPKDERIRQWRTLTALVPVEAKRARYENEFQPHVEEALQDFKDGKVKAAQIQAEHAL